MLGVEIGRLTCVAELASGAAWSSGAVLGPSGFVWKKRQMEVTYRPRPTVSTQHPTLGVALGAQT